MASTPAAPIGDLKELIDYFVAGNKPVERHRIGLEHEKIAVLPDGTAPGHDVIAKIIGSFVKDGWSPMEEAGALIGAVKPGLGTFTLEPGGQLEHSGEPHDTVQAAVVDNDRHLDELVAVAARHHVTLLGTGFRPFFGLDRIPWMPKGRYVVMRDYLPRYGARAHDMMKRTATVQANVDYLDEADAMDKLRVGQGISPLVTSLFAASPLADGRDTGEQTFRASAWLQMDPARCGLLSFLFQPGASFASYVEWALDVPMFFVYRDGSYQSLAGEGFSFRRFIAEGKFGQRATIDDWELHLSTLFPEVRLKRYIEVRQADASTRAMVNALPALWRGIYATKDTQDAAWTLVDGISFADRVQLQHEVPRLALRTKLLGDPLQVRAKALVAIAEHGLATIEPGAVALLQPLVEVATTGRTVADRILADFTRTKGDVTQMIAALAIA
ncbi:MAG: glutamate-cysteine ligase family protein [Polyangia bacterium]